MVQNTNPGGLALAMTQEQREAFLRYRAGKNTRPNEETALMISYIHSDDCVRDLQRLVQRDYSFVPPPHHYRIPKNFSGRKRDVYVCKGTFGYLLKLISYCMREQEVLFSAGLYSFRKSRTAKDFLLKLRKSGHIGDYYIVKADISNYVGSIVPEKIIPKLEELWNDDPALVDLLKFLLLRRECIERDGSVVSCEPGGLGGLPQGNLFMNVYLMELDDYFYPRSPLYCRYSDDIIIFARDREEAQEYYNSFMNILKEKKLTINPDKTRIIEPGGAVDILGFRLKDGTMDISPHAKDKIKRKIRMHANRLLKKKHETGISSEECGRAMIRYCNRLFFENSKNELTWARWLFPLITDTSSLKELDHYVQTAIRYCLCGSMSEKRFRATYEDLQKLGYKSIVHAYYHFEIP